MIVSSPGDSLHSSRQRPSIAGRLGFSRSACRGIINHALGSVSATIEWRPSRRHRKREMRINPEKCVACGNCTYVCPMGAIYIDPVLKRATINSDECVECYSCYNGLSQEHLNPT